MKRLSRIIRQVLAAAEPLMAALYWPCLSAKSAIADERAARQAAPPPAPVQLRDEDDAAFYKPYFDRLRSHHQ